MKWDIVYKSSEKENFSFSEVSELCNYLESNGIEDFKVNGFFFVVDTENDSVFVVKKRVLQATLPNNYEEIAFFIGEQIGVGTLSCDDIVEIEVLDVSISF